MELWGHRGGPRYWNKEHCMQNKRICVFLNAYLRSETKCVFCALLCQNASAAQEGGGLRPGPRWRSVQHSPRCPSLACGEGARCPFSLNPSLILGIQPQSLAQTRKPPKPFSAYALFWRTRNQPPIVAQNNCCLISGWSAVIVFN